MSAPPTEDEVRAVVASVLERLTADDELVAPPVQSAEHDGVQAEIALGSDHGGFFLKKRIAGALQEKGIAVRDCGTHGTESVDYPDFAHAVARLVADGGCRWGIVVDGAGIGSCMAANKVPGIRAATCWDVSSAKNSREHNHANVLVLGAGLIGDNLALEIVDTFLGTAMREARYIRRLAKVRDLERRPQA